MVKVEGNRVWVQYNRKINIGNYESVDVSCGATVDLEESEKLEEKLIKIASSVKKTHRKMVNSACKQHGVTE